MDIHGDRVFTIGNHMIACSAGAIMIAQVFTAKMPPLLLAMLIGATIGYLAGKSDVPKARVQHK